MSDVGREQRHDPYFALRSGNYRAFAAGFLTSSTGLQMLATAIGWEVWERTEDPLALGYIGLTRAVPVLILALPAGHASDLYNRKYILMLSQIGFALSAAGLAAASYLHAPVWVLYALLALTGCARSLAGPARASLLPLLVDAPVFHNAITWNSGVFQFSAIAGPLAAGALIAATGEAWPVYVCAALGCAIFAGSAGVLRPRAAERGTGKFTLASMGAGLGHVLREKTILATLTLDLMAVLLGGATALLPIYADEVLHVGALGLGWLRAMPYVGALVMSLVLAHRPPFARAGPALLWSVAGFGACTIVFGLSRDITLSLAMLFLLGALDNVSVVVRHVLVQVRTPDSLRGRVSAVNSVFIESSNELGAFESGLVARLFSPLISVVSGGIGTIVMVGAIAMIWPEIRRLGALRLEDPTPTPAPPTPARAATASPTVTPPAR